MSSLQRTPRDLETPRYAVLQRRAAYEVRQYDAFLAATAPTRAGGAASDDGGAFGTLARYIFGGNVQSAPMAMTTPVFTTVRDGDSGGVTMAFPMERKWGDDPAALPAPVEGTRVARVAVPRRVVAAAAFAGIPSDADAAREAAALRSALLRDGLRPAEGFQLARYNDPSTPGPLRRNEVLIELQDDAAAFTRVQ